MSYLSKYVEIKKKINYIMNTFYLKRRKPGGRKMSVADFQINEVNILFDMEVKETKNSNEISLINNAIIKAKNNLDNAIKLMKNIAVLQQNEYWALYTKALARLDMSNIDNDQKAAEYRNAIDEVNSAWTSFGNNLSDFIKLLTDSGKIKENKVSDLFGLKAYSIDNKAKKYEATENRYSALATAQAKAVEAQRIFNKLEEALLTKTDCKSY